MNFLACKVKQPGVQVAHSLEVIKMLVFEYHFSVWWVVLLGGSFPYDLFFNEVFILMLVCV